MKCHQNTRWLSAAACLLLLLVGACASDSPSGASDGGELSGADPAPDEGSTSEQQTAFLDRVTERIDREITDERLLEVGETLCSYADQASGDPTAFIEFFLEWLDAPGGGTDLQVHETERIANAAFAELCPRHEDLPEALEAEAGEECKPARELYDQASDNGALLPPIAELESTFETLVGCQGPIFALEAAQDWSMGGSEVPDPFGDCLKSHVDAEPVTFVLRRYLTDFDEPLPQPHRNIWAEAMTECVPGYYLVNAASEGQLQHLLPTEQTCLDQAYASEPFLLPYFETLAAEEDFTAMSDEAVADFFTPIYECSRLAAMVFDPAVADLLADESNACVTSVAREFSWLESGVTNEEAPNFEQQLLACLSEEEQSLLGG